jgi:hypothetical protein
VELLARVPGYPDAVDREKEGAAIDAAFAELERVDRIRALDLEVTVAGLSARGRERLEPRLLVERWRTIRSTGDQAASDTLAADLRELIVHVGDLSNLILDSDLDSYYLMDVSLLATPDVLVRINAERARILRTEDSQDEDAGASLFAALYGDIDSARIETSSRNALTEDPNFYGVSETLAHDLDRALESRIAVSRSLVEAARERAGGAEAEKYLDWLSSAIRSAVEEQARGAQEIMNTIIELRSTSEENARSSKSLASLSGTLKAESLALDAIVGEFTLAEEAAS